MLQYDNAKKEMLALMETFVKVAKDETKNESERKRALDAANEVRTNINSIFDVYIDKDFRAQHFPHGESIVTSVAKSLNITFKQELPDFKYKTERANYRIPDSV